MSPDEYKEKFGGDWRQFTNTEAGAHFLKMLEDNHPVRRIPKGESNLGYRTNGAVALLNEITGYEAQMEMIRSLSEARREKADEEEESFSEPEIQ